MMSLRVLPLRLCGIETSCVGSISQQRNLGRRAPKPGKPPVLPPSKKVLYHVVHVPWQEPEDVKELLWRRHVYNNAVVSLREVFRQEIQQKASAGLGLDAMREAEEDELNQLLEENENFNRKKAETRSQHEKEDWKRTKEVILTEIEESLINRRNQAEAATSEVRAAIERSRNFVTKDNLESKILAALESPVVYDFCIDRRGEKLFDPAPVKYQEGTPTRQKGRLYDATLGAQPLAHVQIENLEKTENT